MRFAARCCCVLISAASVARAESPTPRCSGPELVLDPPLSQHRAWSRAAGDARKRVAELTDLDTCARLEVEQTPESVRVRANSTDGRSVVRELAGPGELEATVVALLVLPPVSEPGERAAPAAGSKSTSEPASPPPPPAPKAPSNSAADPAADAGVTGKASGHARPPSGNALELALGGTARTASYLFGPGASLMVNADLGGWLLGGMLHLEQTSSSEQAATRFVKQQSASAAFVVGRRLFRAPFYLDVALAAPIVALGTSQWVAETQQQDGGEDPEREPGDDDDEPSDDAPPSAPKTSTETRTLPPHADLRFGGLIRAIAPLTGGFGMFAALDAEHTLGIVPQPSASGQPRVIGWTAGASLGIFWSNR